MSDQRVALYVYDKGPVTFAPDGAVDLYRMNDDYSAELMTRISEPTTLTLAPGVYGYAYRASHGISVDRTVHADLVVDLQRKKPWPQPPPPPPPSFAGRRDWNEHTIVFMSPLSFDDGGGQPAAEPPSGG